MHRRPLLHRARILPVSHKTFELSEAQAVAWTIFLTALTPYAYHPRYDSISSAHLFGPGSEHSNPEWLNE
jgi:hypothetical protein